MAFDPIKWHTTISDQIKQFNPEIDTSLGTVVGDVVVLPLSIIREILDKTRDFVGSIYYLDGIVALLKDDSRIDDISEALGISPTEVRNTLKNVIENIANDYALTRLSARSATGTVYYIPKSHDLGTYTVGPSDRVRSIFNIYYRPVTTFVFNIQSDDDWAKYFVLELGTYGFPVTVECEQVGSIGNIGPQQIDYDFGYYLQGNYSRAVNLLPIIGGSDEETDEQLVERIKSKWKGTRLGTIPGYKQLFIQYNVRDVYVAGPGDPFMQRATTGAVDVYIRDYQILTVQREINIPSANTPIKIRDLLKDYMYVRDVKPTSGTITITIEKDTNPLWEWSTRANDTLTCSQSGSIIVNITYNATVAEIQKVLDLEENRVLGLDVMVREARPLDFTVKCSLTYLTQYSPSTVQQNVRTALVNYVKSLPLGSKVAISDLVNVVEDVPGVDTVPSLQILKEGGPVETVQALPIEFLNLTEVTIV